MVKLGITNDGQIQCANEARPGVFQTSVHANVTFQTKTARCLSSPLTPHPPLIPQTRLSVRIRVKFLRSNKSTTKKEKTTKRTTTERQARITVHNYRT